MTDRLSDLMTRGNEALKKIEQRHHSSPEFFRVANDTHDISSSEAQMMEELTMLRQERVRYRELLIKSKKTIEKILMILPT